jgi:hypothetical protein
MYHLVILHRFMMLKEVGFGLRWRKNVTKKRQALKTLSHPERVYHSRHIHNLAWTNSPPHYWHHAKHHPHNGCKITIFFGSYKKK